MATCDKIDEPICETGLVSEVNVPSRNCQNLTESYLGS